MPIDGTATEFLRHRVHRPEIDHIERTKGHNLRQTEGARHVEPLGAGRKRATSNLIGKFGGGEVEHAANDAVAHQGFHRPSASTIGMEDENLVAVPFHDLAGNHGGGRGDAEHGYGDDGLFRLDWPNSRFRHGGDRRRGVGDDPLRDYVKAGEIDDWIVHHDV